MRDPAEVTWQTDGETREALYFSARGDRPPARAVAADDRMTADAAFRHVSQGTALVWSGDYHNGRQLLTALARRADRRRRDAVAASPASAFHAYRQDQAQRARLLGRLLVPLDEGRLPLRRAPEVTQAIAEAGGPVEGLHLLPLRDVLAFISAHEWRRNGVAVAALDGARIHPHFGVFPPTRQDYVELVARATLPADRTLAFDLGVGTGVLSAVLLHRGVQAVVATDSDPRARACAADNFGRLGLGERVRLDPGGLYPAGTAPLVVCNPPWLPGKASTSLEGAVYDPASAMLRGFLDGLRAHLAEGGEGWLVMSDLAELLELRAPGELAGWIAAAGLKVVERLDALPSPKTARETSDPLFFARSRETVSLWRLSASAPS